MEGHARISEDVLGTYAADAAREVPGVERLVEEGRNRGLKLETDDGGLQIELHVALEWGASVPEVGSAVQTRVTDYLDRMANVRPRRVDVVVDEVGAPPATG